MRQDILLDSNDLAFGNNDFLTGVSDNQHAQLLLLYNKGDLTQYPNIGVGIMQYLKGSIDGVFRRDIQLQFAADGYKLNNFSVTTGGEVNINFS